jgi:hypothetical protein
MSRLFSPRPRPFVLCLPCRDQAQLEPEYTVTLVVVYKNVLTRYLALAAYECIRNTRLRLSVLQRHLSLLVA